MTGMQPIPTILFSPKTFFLDPTKSLPSVSDSKLDLPDLPTVPSDTPPHDATPDQKNDENDEDLDFDDLTRRFEALKKKKWRIFKVLSCQNILIFENIIIRTYYYITLDDNNSS